VCVYVSECVCVRSEVVRSRGISVVHESEWVCRWVVVTVLCCEREHGTWVEAQGYNVLNEKLDVPAVTVPVGLFVAM
jgi:hypothetical protein